VTRSTRPPRWRTRAVQLCDSSFRNDFIDSPTADRPDRSRPASPRPTSPRPTSRCSSASTLARATRASTRSYAIWWTAARHSCRPSWASTQAWRQRASGASPCPSATDADVEPHAE
jgi:hypothetical protein